jgi:hypothetical protein
LCKEKKGYHPKFFQCLIPYLIVERRDDVIVRLPTNAGKTLPMLLSVFLTAKKWRKSTLIILPLVSLMTQVKSEMDAFGISSCIAGAGCPLPSNPGDFEASNFCFNIF